MTNVKVSNLNIPYQNDSSKAGVVIQFDDESAGEHKFELKKGTTVVKTFI